MSYDNNNRFSQPTNPSGTSDFYATPRQAFTPGSGMSRPVTASRPLPVRAPLPGWAKVLIGLGVAVLALMLLGILAAIAIPVFLNGRNQAADVSVKADLKTVASAEAAYFTKFGTYTRDPTQLGIAEPKNDIGILTADANGFCLGGRVADTQGRDWYYSPAGGVTRTPCA